VASCSVRYCSKVTLPYGCQVATGAVRTEHSARQPNRQQWASLSGYREVASGEIGYRTDLWAAEIRCSPDRFIEGETGQAGTDFACIDRLKAPALRAAP
jgi:hypothetical protein